PWKPAAARRWHPAHAGAVAGRAAHRRRFVAGGHHHYTGHRCAGALRYDFRRETRPAKRYTGSAGSKDGDGRVWATRHGTTEAVAACWWSTTSKASSSWWSTICGGPVSRSCWRKPAGRRCVWPWKGLQPADIVPHLNLPRPSGAAAPARARLLPAAILDFPTKAER